MHIEFDSPFDFFQAFGDFWEANGWQKIGHQLEDLFVRLHAFLTAYGLKKPHVALGLMKLDYFMNHKYKPRKVWWHRQLQKEEASRVLQWAAVQAELVSEQFAALGLSEKELHKHAVVEMIPLEAVIRSRSLGMSQHTEHGFETTDEGLTDEVYGIFLYQQTDDEKPLLFTVNQSMMVIVE